MAKIKTGSKTPKEPKKKVTAPLKEFSLDMPDVSSVYLAADFNQWGAEEVKLKKDKTGIWKAEVKLAPGVYQYKFVVDGRWIEDPANPNTQNDPYGGSNSVIVVE